MNEITTLFVLANFLLTTFLVLTLMKFKRSLPDFQEVFNTLGGDITETLQSVFEKPAVSKAMSVLGKKSGDVRSTKALREKVAGNLLDQQPLIKTILGQLDISPVEGLQLMNDPIVGPMIQGFLQKGLSGLGKMGGATPRLSGPSNSGSRGVGYG